MTSLTASAETGDTAAINVTIKAIARTCAFEQEIYTTNLPAVGTEAFLTAGIAGVTEVPVTLNCQNGVENVSIVPSGHAAEGDVTAFKNTGTAKNVGLRLLDSHNGVLTPDGDSLVRLSPAEGQASYTFRAGYVPTGGPVSAGTFLAQVSLSVAYQ